MQGVSARYEGLWLLVRMNMDWLSAMLTLLIALYSGSYMILMFG